MPGGNPPAPLPIRFLHQSPELDPGITEHTGVGRPAMAVFLQEIADHLLPERLPEIQHRQGDLQGSRRRFGSIHHCLMQLRHPHDDRPHLIALLPEQMDADAGIHPARQGYQNGATGRVRPVACPRYAVLRIIHGCDRSRRRHSPPRSPPPGGGGQSLSGCSNRKERT